MINAKKVWSFGDAIEYYNHDNKRDLLTLTMWLGEKKTIDIIKESNGREIEITFEDGILDKINYKYKGDSNWILK